MRYLLWPAGAALMGVLPLPIDAYYLIRWIVAGICIFAVCDMLRKKFYYGLNIFVIAVVAFIYNPLIPFYLSRGIWLVIDILSAGYLVWFVFQFESSRELTNLHDKIDPKMDKLEEKGDSFTRKVLITSILSLMVIFFY